MTVQALIALLDDPDAKDMLETARADIAMLRVKLNGMRRAGPRCA